MPVLDGILLFDIVASLEVATLYFSYKSMNKIMNYEIKKDFDTTEISKFILPESLKESIQNSQNIRSITLKKATMEFASVLTNNFENAFLTNFYRNIKDVKVRNMLLFEYIKSDATGYYSIESPRNTIVVSKYINIFHELFHMASSFYEEEGVFHSGFETSYKTDNPKIFKVYGKGLNEGYTELLTKRYFGEKHKIKLSYKKEMNIAFYLELIVGQNLMEKLYLTANQTALISELKKYAPADDVLKLIDELDKKNINIKLIYSNILKMYKNKILFQVKIDKLAFDEAKTLINQFETSLYGETKNKYTTKKGLH